MTISALAGKPATREILVNVDELEREYYRRRPDVSQQDQLVSFGTSGHRGSSFRGSFNEWHIQAVVQAICDYRQSHRIDGPLYMGKDTHALSGPAQCTALEVLAANGVQTVIQRDDGITPTPVISRAILVHNRDREQHHADGIVVTPSHNPPEDGGIKYNPPNGGPADVDVTKWIETRANDLLRSACRDVRKVSPTAALNSETTHEQDLVLPYVEDLANVVDVSAIRNSRLILGVDPLGGAALPYWAAINAIHKLDITITNTRIDPTFSFMTMDHDGRIRMDPSSPYAMASLLDLKDKFRLSFANDADADRHGIVVAGGLMQPNHFLAVAVRYLLPHRPHWSETAMIGKTIVSSSIIDRVVEKRKRRLYEVPVGFKWFVSGLLHGSCCFGGEESAGASFLRKDGTVWTTDKDGLIMDLLAAEVTAVTGKDPSEHYTEITGAVGTSHYTRIDMPATRDLKARLAALSPQAVFSETLAGETIVAKLTQAPGNGAPIGGLKVVTQNGWFAARPSGTEDIYKLYAESLRDQAHLEAILRDAEEIVGRALGKG